MSYQIVNGALAWVQAKKRTDEFAEPKVDTPVSKAPSKAAPKPVAKAAPKKAK